VRSSLTSGRPAIRAAAFFEAASSLIRLLPECCAK